MTAVRLVITWLRESSDQRLRHAIKRQKVRGRWKGRTGNNADYAAISLRVDCGNPMPEKACSVNGAQALDRMLVRCSLYVTDYSGGWLAQGGAVVHGGGTLPVREG